ncbi:MAG TPA: arsenate reductase ArsC [Deltaproteobacteria bacterium]|nr:arsenate reductase ArsC [Deltaproteobacteria bacterium]
MPGSYKVLFVCGHNSARSQMAQAWLNHVCPSLFEAQSAGICPSDAVNPLAVEAMREVGIDISASRPRSVYDVYKSGEVYSHIITVCDRAAAEKCPVFLGLVRQIHWSFPDPAALTGTREEVMEGVRAIRDAIRDRIVSWCEEIRRGGAEA